MTATASKVQALWSFGRNNLSFLGVVCSEVQRPNTKAISFEGSARSRRPGSRRRKLNYMRKPRLVRSVVCSGRPKNTPGTPQSVSSTVHPKSAVEEKVVVLGTVSLPDKIGMVELLSELLRMRRGRWQQSEPCGLPPWPCPLRTRKSHYHQHCPSPSRCPCARRHRRRPSGLEHGLRGRHHRAS